MTSNIITSIMLFLLAAITTIGGVFCYLNIRDNGATIKKVFILLVLLVVTLTAVWCIPHTLLQPSLEIEIAEQPTAPISPIDDIDIELNRAYTSGYEQAIADARIIGQQADGLFHIAYQDVDHAYDVDTSSILYSMLPFVTTR